MTSKPQQTAEVIPLPGQDETAVARAYEDSRVLLVKFLTHRLGSEAEAQDVAQSAFLRLWQRRGELSGDNLSALLFVTARNMATDILRSRRSGRLSPLHHGRPDEAAVCDEAPSPERIAIGRSELAHVRKIVAELPDKCRRAFQLYQFEGVGYGEIAARMGLTESMVRKYVRRAVVHCAARYARVEGWE